MAHLWNIFIAATLAYSGLFVTLTHQTKATWSYVPLSTFSNSSNEEMMKLDFRTDRVSRGVYAISASIVMNFDTDDNTIIETMTSYSATSNMDFKKLSIGATKDTIDNMMMSYYKDFLMDSLATCSNFPQMKGDSIVWEKKTYEAKNCQLSVEKLPSHMQPGYYKVELVGTGTLDWYVQFIAQVESDTAYF